MTPAEQGQDPKLRASTQDVSDRQTEAGAAHELEQIRFDLGLMGPLPGDTREHVQTALRELEMCQRYFPFMRRSRDEAVKREKALREALQEIADTNGWEFANVLADKARAALDQSGKGAR